MQKKSAKLSIIITFSLIVLTLLLLSCTEKATSIEPTGSAEPAVPVVGEEIELPPIDKINKTTSPAPSTPCTAGWACLSSSTKIYRLENCSFAERVDCKFGCVNDECRKPSTCPAGFKCDGQYYKGYQLEDCSWISKSKCEWGCENAECLPQPNETTTTTASPATTTAAETAPPPPKATTLKAGETGTFKIGGVEHTIKIYNLEGSRARLEVDGQRSDWVEEGKRVTFANGITIKVAEILLRGSSSSLPSEIGYIVE